MYVGMTILIATSVVRGSRQGESHGGVFLIDLERRTVVDAIQASGVRRLTPLGK